jgi:hypothetical protein
MSLTKAENLLSSSSSSTRRAVPERSWVQSLLPTTEVEPEFSSFGGMLVPVLQLISPVCKTGSSL